MKNLHLDNSNSQLLEAPITIEVDDLIRVKLNKKTRDMIEEYSGLIGCSIHDTIAWAISYGVESVLSFERLQRENSCD